MNIVVLAGGLSPERDVSLITGKMVSEALRSNGHQALLLDVYLGYGSPDDSLEGVFARSGEAGAQAAAIMQTAPDIAKVKAMRKDDSGIFFGPNVLKLCRMADIVFMALHGEDGENGKVQAVFDLFGVRYTGSGCLGSAVSMNKEISKQIYAMHGIPTPKGISMKKSAQTADIAETGLTFPCVIKPCCGGSSIGVSIAYTQEEYKAALEEAFRWEEEVLVEEYIKGREFSVGVIGYEALPVIEIAPIEGFYDYKNKYQAGSAVETCPADLPPQIASKMQAYAVEAAKAAGLDTYARMDFLLDAQENLYCLEANTLPGMTPTSLLPQEAQAVGMDYAALCEKIIQISMEKFQ